jgi:hypothetical protein
MALVKTLDAVVMLHISRSSRPRTALAAPPSQPPTS